MTAVLLSAKIPLIFCPEGHPATPPSPSHNLFIRTCVGLRWCRNGRAHSWSAALGFSQCCPLFAHDCNTVTVLYFFFNTMDNLVIRVDPPRTWSKRPPRRPSLARPQSRRPHRTKQRTGLPSPPSPPQASCPWSCQTRCQTAQRTQDKVQGPGSGFEYKP